MKNVILESQRIFIVTSTKSKEIFSCLWYILEKKLKYDSLLLFSTNFNVHKDFWVQGIVLWQTKRFTRAFLFNVNTFRECFLEHICFSLIVLFLFLLNLIEQLSHCFILRIQLYCLFQIFQSLIKLFQSFISNSSVVIWLWVLIINFY